MSFLLAYTGFLASVLASPCRKDELVSLIPYRYVSDPVKAESNSTRPVVQKGF